MGVKSTLSNTTNYIQSFINSAYDQVKAVYDSLTEIISVADNMDDVINISAAGDISALSAAISAFLATPTATTKPPCIVATTTNITLANLQTVDGISVTTIMRVCVKDQTNPIENGIYLPVDGGTWVRTTDWDGSIVDDVVEGTLMSISRGSVNQGTWWNVTTTGSITVGITGVTIALAASLAAVAIAVAAAAAAAVSADFLDDRMLGSFTTGNEPTLDNDGNALLTGAQYFNTTLNRMKTWNGTAWQLVTASAIDIIITDAGNLFTGTEVETALQEIVTLANDQTITGKKTHSDDVILNAELVLNAGYSEDADSYGLGGAITLDIAISTYFYPTGVLTSIPTFTFSNPAAAGRVTSFVMEVRNGAVYTPIWPASVEWSRGNPPEYTTGKDIFTFSTRDNGTTWIGYIASLDSQ